jgi:hypothetical protein
MVPADSFNRDNISATQELRRLEDGIAIEMRSESINESEGRAALGT